jgi:hypothetical protein
MENLIRCWLFDGDSTVEGGIARGSCATFTTMTDDGVKLNAVVEGDSIFCPACNSVGHIKHIPPFRSQRIQINGVFKRQCLDGDLCICKCPTPPVVRASNKRRFSSFQASEITGDALSWFIRAGHSPAAIGLDHQLSFLAVDRADQPLAAVPYKITLADGSEHFGVTDAQGMTEKIHTDSNGLAELEIPYHGDDDSASHDHAHHCSC